jgi:hypothetical protein
MKLFLLVPLVAASAASAALLHPAVRAQQAQPGEASSGARGLVPIPPRSAPASDFDAAATTEALSAADLAAREASFDELLATAHRDPAAAAWIEETAQGTGELAWTARLALRELQRSRPHSPFDVWNGASDLDEFERMIEEFTGRVAPGWNSRLDPFVVPFPGLQQQTPIAPGQAMSRAKRVDVQNGTDGWTIRVTETVDGEENVREYKGATLEEILEANPELKDEVGVSGALVGPGISFRIGSPANQPFDFDALRRNLGVRPPPAAGAEEAGVRTDILGVIARPASAEEGGHGLYVRSIAPGTIAALLGITGGDVLLEVNGKALSSVDDVTAALAARGQDGRVEAVWRDGSGRRRTGSWRP